MTLTAAAQWLNTAFAGYDKAILKIMHSLAGALGPVLTPLMKLITFLGEKGLLLLLLSLVLMCFARTRRIGVCVFGAVCCGALITNFILKDWIARPRPFETVDLYRQLVAGRRLPRRGRRTPAPSGHVTARGGGHDGAVPDARQEACRAVGDSRSADGHIAQLSHGALPVTTCCSRQSSAWPRPPSRITSRGSSSVCWRIARTAGICAFVLNFDLPVRLPGAYKGRHEK